MVKGLDIFRDYFKDHTDKYILIGGTACDIAMGQMGLDFRATKDLDIVLIVEALNAEFGGLIWEFIKKGQYQNKQKSTGKTEFYRFYGPKESTFPYMLEFFARKPEVLKLDNESHLAPIPIDEEISSLSAILLNDDYYNFIINGKYIVEAMPVIPQEYIIPLKSKAYLDLSQRRHEGDKIDKKDIKKHKNDVFRLYQILSPDTEMVLPETISDDMNRFFIEIVDDPPDLKALGIHGTGLAEVLNNLKKIYSLV